MVPRCQSATNPSVRDLARQAELLRLAQQAGLAELAEQAESRRERPAQLPPGVWKRGPRRRAVLDLRMPATIETGLAAIQQKLAQKRA
jgi:hypothetical protein